MQYQGDLQGESRTEYLMVYRADGSASYTGLERIEGTLNGRSGSFVIQGSGVYDPGAKTASTDSIIVEGSGTGELASIRGKARCVSTHENIPLIIDYELD